jgi:hypothetical protein
MTAGHSTATIDAICLPRMTSTQNSFVSSVEATHFITLNLRRVIYLWKSAMLVTPKTVVSVASSTYVDQTPIQSTRSLVSHPIFSVWTSVNS